MFVLQTGKRNSEGYRLINNRLNGNFGKGD